MQTDTIKILTNNVPGWLTEKEGMLLYNLAKNCSGKGVIVEIGSWKGKSTICLAKGTKAGSNINVYAIDPHSGSNNFEEFKQNIEKAEVDDIVTPIVQTSKDASVNFNKPIELIFIDGSHEYEDVKADLELWYPKVVNEGVMAFHDSLGNAWQGPKEVVDKFLYQSRNFRHVRFRGSITLAQKIENYSQKDYLRNRIGLLYKNLIETWILFRIALKRK